MAIIKDNNPNIPREALKDIPKVLERIANKTLDQLEKENIFVFPNALADAEDITKDQTIIKTYPNHYQTGNVMGFIGVDNERLEIQSRFSTGEKDYFFQYLLSKVFEIPNIVDMKTNATENDRFFDLLVFLFPHYLKEAMRKGVFKTYIRKQYNDDNVKGTIDIARHIKQNTPFIGKIAYNTREYSYDNYLMQLIRHTIEFIKTKPYGNKLLYNVKDEVSDVVDATNSYSLSNRRKVIDSNKKNVVRHAFYHEYRSLQQLCIMILQNERHQIGFGKHTTYGILFDGAWLWEEYLNKLISDKFYHPMNKAKKDKQFLFYNESTKQNVGEIYPDFISRDSKNRIIADAKYKPSKNIHSDDYLQLLAYMYRFGANKGYYLYPDNTGESPIELLLNEGTTFENNVKEGNTSVLKVGLNIPPITDTYIEFVEKMGIAENSFRKLIKEHL